MKKIPMKLHALDVQSFVVEGGDRCVIPPESNQPIETCGGCNTEEENCALISSDVVGIG